MPGPNAATNATRNTPKIHIVIAMLEGKNGVSVEEICEATGWQRHTARAALSGLRKQGYVIQRSKSAETSRYAISKGVSTGRGK